MINKKKTYLKTLSWELKPVNESNNDSTTTKWEKRNIL
jgi:hypothetical protein